MIALMKKIKIKSVMLRKMTLECFYTSGKIN